ncbi:Methyl-viologen-reducing hydrogenase subunit D [Thermoplasmatales archaeon SCGC AB-539-N05]|nr:Methyl-viologen-reducing hydrogenase subunit D [Thermoplasmatales archaeon SCGC AB-539-N05]ENO12256.1 coenzyme F420-reducing hydrogenase, delta subunit [Thermoplasmatales archaeon SCGC AB-539-C06]
MKNDEEFMPKILAFLCNWCSYAGADLAGTSRLKYPPSILPIRVMCSSRVDPLFVLRAYLGGADGVLVAGCHPGDCHYEKGNYYTRRRFAMFKKIIEDVGLESDRFRLSWISASEGHRYAKVATEFTEKIKKLGSNSAKSEIFL